ncbi:NAD(P)/FAD-dependent oxidoreductase [Streptomyces sp. NPDC056452]|uniref:NAD(P)/FAD-dependent oxidoreductase n=1 Tax=Streptomyces sp. NPDC056452 TaxID=3345821 RepID=UPI0036CAA3C7
MTRRYDVVVAGAGMAGVLTALGLAGHGVRVLLVEPHGVGAGQSGQSHGYLHRGYAYGRTEPLLPPLLGRAREHWDALLRDTSPVTSHSLVSFSDPEAARGATEFWRSCGLPVSAVEAPDWLGGGFASCFRSEEATHDFGQVLRHLGARIAACGVDVDAGTLTGFSEEPGGVHCEFERPDGTGLTVRSRAVVVAAGAGTPGILARSGLPPVVRCRKSFVLVLRGDLPVISAVFPAGTEHGLFLASRTGHESGTTWLVSDFQSFDSAWGASGQLPGWWAHRILLTLRRIISPERLAGVATVSGYAAVKSGLVPSSGTVSHGLGHDFLAGRAIVASPSKLTLAPLAAERAMRSVARVLKFPFDGAAWDPVPAGTGRGSEGSRTGEKWETGLDAVKDPDLASGPPDIAELSRLFSR